MPASFSRITIMIFVPMRGGIANAMRASGRLILLRTRTKAEQHSIVLNSNIFSSQLKQFF